MNEAAADESFEAAARYRNRLFAVQHLVERQAVERESVGTIDVIGFAAEGDRAVVQIFPLRGGKMVDRHSFHLENVGGQDLTTVIESFALEYYGSAPSVPPQIIVPRDSGDLSALAEFLSEKRGARVEVRTAERGEKRRLQQLADENAQHTLVSEQAATEQKRARRVEALEELREALNLESLPLRIECYDISHAMGQDPVGSMVVFQDGLARKSDYRKFGIKTATRRSRRLRGDRRGDLAPVRAPGGTPALSPESQMSYQPRHRATTQSASAHHRTAPQGSGLPLSRRRLLGAGGLAVAAVGAFPLIEPPTPATASAPYPRHPSCNSTQLLLQYFTQ